MFAAGISEAEVTRHDLALEGTEQVWSNDFGPLRSGAEYFAFGEEGDG